MVHTKVQSPQNVPNEKVKVKEVSKWQKAYSCLSLSLSLSLLRTSGPQVKKIYSQHFR